MDQQPPEGVKPPVTPDNLPNPEKPSGHIRVNVSQPELLYLIAKTPLDPEDKRIDVPISQTSISDQMLSNERSSLYRPDPKYDKVAPGFKYQTDLRLLPEAKNKPHQGYYTPDRTAKVLEGLKTQGVIVDMDTIINGQQRLKIYHPNGSYGVEVFLGWPSKEVHNQYLTYWGTKSALSIAEKKSVDELTEEQKLKMQQEIQYQLNENPRINVSLTNRNRLDTTEGWNTKLPIPANEAEFLEQTEFYRKTLEQVLRALYQEAQVTPNVDITLRPPNASGDSLDRIASISPETAKPITEAQLHSEIVNLNDIKGQPEAVREARRLVRAINEPELYERRGIKPPRGILFVGPPGTGKTMLAKGIATEAHADFISINAANIGSKWINESAQLMNAVFDDAERRVAEGKKVIIFIDEIDAIASNRDTTRMHVEDVKTISIMLQGLMV